MMHPFNNISFYIYYINKNFGNVTHMPPMSHENLEELRSWGDELVEEGDRIRQIREKLMWKHVERHIHDWLHDT